jgi:hypothetical protein
MMRAKVLRRIRADDLSVKAVRKMVAEMEEQHRAGS